MSCPFCGSPFDETIKAISPNGKTIFYTCASAFLNGVLQYQSEHCSKMAYIQDLKTEIIVLKELLEKQNAIILKLKNEYRQNP